LMEDDFTTPLVNGQSVSTPPEFGNLVSITADPGDHLGPAIFDSNPAGPNAGGTDPDLLVGQGNLLILQSNDNGTQTVPGIFDVPDDYRFGGKFTFSFDSLDLTRQVEMTSIDLVDMCIAPIGGARVTLTDVLGRQRIYDVPAGWTTDISAPGQGPPGFGTLDLTTLDPQPGFAATATASEIGNYIPEECSLMEVELFGSGGIGEIAFDREADPGGGAPEAGADQKQRRRRKL